MSKIAKPALIAAFIAPIQSVAGWWIAASLWPEYDPIKLTISDLAAPESPVSAIMSSFFIFGASLSIIVAIWGRAFTKLGRLAFLLAGICTIGLTIFPTPLDSYSIPHRIFAISGFVISAAWPLMAMRKHGPLVTRPTWSIIATALQATLAVYFLFIWADPNATNIGVWERIVAVSQSLYASVIVVVLYFANRRIPS
ncbi:MAG: DUF998 domain-containing protein [Micrococcales bacterium]